VLPILLLSLVIVQPGGRAAAAVQRVKVTAGGNYLVVEALRDDIVHFELGVGAGPDPAVALYTSQMVLKTDYGGPTGWTDTTVGSVRTFETPSVKVDVNTTTLCVTETDKANGNQVLTTLCPLNLTLATKGLTITQSSTTNVYGLGEKFMTVGSADGDWVGKVRSPGSDGNVMEGWNGGAAGNAQFPIMYALGSGNNNYALFLDTVYKQTWTFNTTPWKVETPDAQLRWYMITGPNLPNLRQDYMELTGRPLVPPKKALGLWVSEYGFDNWAEVDGKLTSLRSNKFPIDGFVMDLQWFGGITAGSDNSNMGKVSWDTVNFPNPTTKLTNYKNNDGIGIITIEESYISKGLTEWTNLSNLGYLVRAGCATCAPVYLTSNPWWGKGGMIDWTIDAAGDYWFTQKRLPLINTGVIGHWIDLGEPEMYDATDWTSGIVPGQHNHAAYHNMYAFKWAQSIYDGYNKPANAITQRPFQLSRSGAPGIQRFGVGMWSADIGSNFANLATHLNAQMHVSLSGVDYFGADIGGFHRGACGSCDLNNLYTQWYANGAWFDVPVRPHTENLCNCKQTAPDQIGDLASNLANTRQRYELTPYLYSLAYRAYLNGEPVFPPLVYYYQTDTNVRTMGNEKLVGRDILVASVFTQGETQRNVYLPAGDWINYNTNTWYHSTGQTYTNIPEYINGVFRLPAFARAGAIIPKMFVDDKTMNVLGKRTDGTTRDELVARVYASTTASNFTLYEDDGQSKDYVAGSNTRTTVLSQQKTSSTSATVTVGAAVGTYTGAPSSRNNVVELVVENQSATGVTMNGTALTQLTSQAAFDAASSGWYNAGTNLILAKSGSQLVGAVKVFVFTLGAPVPTATPTNTPVPVSQRFVCYNGTTVTGDSVYVVGSIPVLGSWAAQNAVKLNPDGPYPTWTGTISGLPASTVIEWKCIKRHETGDTTTVVMWQPGSNSVFTSAASGSGGNTYGDFNNANTPTGVPTFQPPTNTPGASPTPTRTNTPTLTPTRTNTPTITPTPSTVAVTFNENATTVWGQNVYIVGSIPALGSWNTNSAIALSSAGYPIWSGTVSLPPNTAVLYKYIKKDGSGNVIWESDPNRSFTTPNSGTYTLNDTWR
jgi:alpha-glucosidase